MNQQLVTLMPLVLLIVIMYFLLIRPQKKREKAVTAMRNSIKVGDEVITIGGICGKIVKTKDETLTIQVGADKTKFEIMRWAVSKVVTDEPALSSKKAMMNFFDTTPFLELKLICKHIPPWIENSGKYNIKSERHDDSFTAVITKKC